MTSSAQAADRDQMIRFLAHRLLVERGWPKSGNFHDYYDLARTMCDAGQGDMAFGSPVPEAVLEFRKLQLQK